ncbi:K transporter [Bifidobacterium bohemicum DSM 22767]|uniref:K transporter n=1 Tax=Bifidobacterium bohemicum DSM 22767 TaxID=1437606 RepID=A0A086ZHT8_9BIFI|nr:K transporter [Bifidobacterium bohemicum DSM 22767]
MSVVTTDEPFTREYSVEDFGTDYMFRVRIRLGFKVSQSIPAYIHQVMHDLSATGELPAQVSVYPKVDADPDIGTVRYVLIHKALMPESKLSAREALSLKMKYAIRRFAGSPVKWFGLAPYNPVVEVQPLFVTTRRPPRLQRKEVYTGNHHTSAPVADDYGVEKTGEVDKVEAGESSGAGESVVRQDD